MSSSQRNARYNAVDVEMERMYQRYVQSTLPAERILQSAREDAASEAEDLPRQREEEKVKKILKGRKAKCLEPIKEKVNMARKPSMRTIEQYLCDICDKVIANSSEGFIVQGNIYVADPSSLGGLIGNNIPEPKDGQVNVEEIHKTVMCKSCFCNALSIHMPAKDQVRDKSSLKMAGPRSNRNYNGLRSRSRHEGENYASASLQRHSEIMEVSPMEVSPLERAITEHTNRGVLGSGSARHGNNSRAASDIDPIIRIMHAPENPNFAREPTGPYTGPYGDNTTYSESVEDYAQDIDDLREGQAEMEEQTEQMRNVIAEQSSR